MDFLLTPFRYEFFTRAILVGMMAGVLCGVMGVYITTRRMSYIAHGLSHAILGGAVLSYVLGLNFYIGSGIWGFFAALLIPASIARLLSNRFSYVMIISGALGATIAFIGIYLSYYFDIASGASVVLLSTLLFACVLLMTSWQRRK